MRRNAAQLSLADQSPPRDTDTDGDRQPALVRRDHFKLWVGGGVSHPLLRDTQGKNVGVRSTEITHSTVAHPHLTGTFLKVNTRRKTFIPEVGKGVPFLNGRDTLDINFCNAPGC
jgi:hypothetical protein